MDKVTAVIECPKGINHKLNWNPEKRSFKLSKILPSGLVFPYDFGMIPDTKGEDGDPLDIIILSEISGFPGLEIDCRIVGALQCEQTERDGQTMRNDRFIGVAERTSVYADIHDIVDISDYVLDELEAFFKNYNEQAGKELKVTNRLNAEAAAELISKQVEATTK